MLAIKLIAEGLGLGALLVLICAAGIKNGAIGMVHLYDKKVQERVAVDLYEKALRALTSKNAYSSKIRENSIPSRTSCVRRYAASCS